MKSLSFKGHPLHVILVDLPITSKHPVGGCPS